MNPAAPTPRLLAALAFLPAVLVALVLLVPMPSFVSGAASLGQVPHDESMSSARWYGPAVERIVEHVGRDGRIAEVSVYDRRIAFDADEHGRIAMWAFDGRSPRHMAIVPSPRVPTRETFSARLLDGRAPERIVAAAEREAGGPVAISVLRLEPEAGGARWTLHGTSDRGPVTLTARADGTVVRSAA